MKNKWLITVVGLTMTLVAITGGGFALAGNGTAAPDVGEPSGDPPTATSIDDIDPNECNWIHNIKACDDTPVIGPDGEGAIEPGFSVGEPYPMPTADKSCGPMAVVAITSEGEVSCLDLAPDTGDDQGQVSPARPPVAEPVR